MFTVGQLAKACDVRTDTVRYYERIGMIGEATRTEAGDRKFGETAAEQIRFIKNAKALGFSLEEIKQLLELANRGASDCAEIREFAEAKIKTLEKKIRQMHIIKRELEQLVAECPGEGIPIEFCNILAKMNSDLNS